MKNSKVNMFGASNSVPENGGEVKTFDKVKLAFESAISSGKDYTPELLDLSTAIAYSVVRKCLDPQRKTAPDRGTVSDNGINPVMLDLRRGIGHDRRTLDNTARAADKATRATVDKNGDPITEVADMEAESILDALMGETLSDGIDLVHTAVVALLEQAADHAGDPGWLDRPYTVRRLSRRVYVRLDDSATYRDDETTPIQEVYRAVRRAVQDSHAVQTDPRNGYTYIEDLTADGLDTIYYRLHKYADLGGYPNNGRDGDTLPGAPAGYSQGGTLYTADTETADEYAKIVAKLNLTATQREVMHMRLSWMPCAKIADRLGVTEKSVYNTLYRIQDKLDAAGIAPDGWTRASRGEALDKPIAVLQMDDEGNVVARYASALSASKETGINAGNIRAAANGKRDTAGGYRWALDK